MAIVDIMSVQITDGSGDVASLPFHYPTGLSLALVQAAMNVIAPLLDAVIDGKITGATVLQNLTLPGGLKAVATGDIERGALIGFDAAATPYKYSIFVPTWASAQFSGDAAVIGAGAGAAFTSSITGGFGTGGSELKPTDKYANDLVTVLDGLKKFRK